MAVSIAPRLGGKSKFPYVLAQSSVPVILVPNGTVATNGTVTLGTALPATYSGGAWIRLPANAIVSGAAGLYWCVFSSTTVGQVYTNFADPASEFIPSIPVGTLVAATGSNSAYTQSTGADVTLVNVLLPANSMGVTGSLIISPFVASPNNANNKIWRTKSGSTNLNSTTNTTATADARPVIFRNAGAANLNFSNGFLGYAQGGSTYPYNRLAIDTSANQTITFTGQMAVATDYIALDAICFEVVE